MTDAALTTAIANLASNTKNTIDEFRAILTELVNRSYKTGDVLMLSCSNAYIIANFDGTGLGIAERVGWAICNGENGTRNYDDRLPLPYGASNLTMGAPKGANTVTLLATNIPPLTIPYTASVRDNGDAGTYLETASTESNGVQTLTTSGTNSTPFSIEPKTIVTLFIQKINL